MADETKGANHFRTSVETGLKIIEALRGHTSGLAVPQFVIDAPGGGGKIPLLPNYVLHKDEEQVILRNFNNKVYSYKNYADKNNPVDWLRIPIAFASSWDILAMTFPQNHSAMPLSIW